MQIVQLGGVADHVTTGKFRSKGNIVFQKNDQKKFVFTTLLYPFRENKLIEVDAIETQQQLDIGNWRIRKKLPKEIQLIDLRNNQIRFRLEDHPFKGSEF